MDDPAALPARELRSLYEQHELSPVEVVSHALERQGALQEQLNAFTTSTPELALDAARDAESRFNGDGPPPALCGIPIAVKDLIDLAGERTTYGSGMFADNITPSDAAVVQALREAGAAFVGKAATHEFAWGITSENAHFGDCRNPWDPARIPGGSSGGSAVAVATGQACIALGTDTAGSIRIPAAYCGVIGFKPTYGLLPLTGIFPLASSLDHAGILGRDAGDIATAFEALLQHSGIHGLRGERGRELQSPPLAGVRVGILDVVGAPAPEPEIARHLDLAAASLADLGADLQDVRFEPGEDPLAILGRVQPVEALHRHSAFGLFPDRAEEYGIDVRGRLEAASSVGLDEYQSGMRARHELAEQLAALFTRVDLLLSPVSPCPPPLIGQTAGLRDLVLPHTALQDLAGLPACAFPIGRDTDGLPVGAQITGPKLGDFAVLAAVRAISE